jgi:DNA polymerase-1
MIKLAMIEIAKELPKFSQASKMILQVHDELVFEAPDSEAEKVAAFVQKTMNEVCKLRAPIETEVGIGNNWGKMEKLA